MSDVFRLSDTTLVDLDGQDAVAILNNLTTNNVKTLEVGCGCETFITDVRGKMLAHVYVYRSPTGFRLFGAGGQADAMLAHFDRYTIREDAVPTDRSGELVFYAIGPAASASLRQETDWGESNAQAFDVDWLGSGTLTVLTETPGAVEQVLRSVGETAADQEAFHHARTLSGFPWFGIDLSEKNLPQEASRIDQTISFTKGCYLGQETVARLDALGQVQKQLLRWQVSGRIPECGCEVTSDEKIVGRLSSIAPTGESEAVAIGMGRRSHFDPGSIAQGEGFQATVVAGASD